MQYALMLTASALTLVTGRFGVKAFSSLLRLSYGILATFIIMLSLLGAFAVDNNTMNIWIMLLFGVVGYFMKKYNFSVAALILGLVLGPMMEESLRRQLLITNGDYLTFITSPISAITLLIALVALLLPLFSKKKGS
nr:tripartite tricarboxylate transporter permease [Lentibacillus daqui]